MNHRALTYLNIQLIYLLDTGKYDHITVSEALKHAKKGDVLEWLAITAGDDFDGSVFSSDAPYPGAASFINRWFRQQENVFEGAENRGICALLSMVNEALQQGTGWEPRG